ncbi:MAG: hypothetical protein ACHQET_03635 [Chitinophagales bacterium]
MKKSFYSIFIATIVLGFLAASCQKENLQTAKDSHGQGSYTAKGSASSDNAGSNLGVSYSPPADPTCPRTCPSTHK